MIVLIALIVIAVVLLVLLLRGESATGSIAPSELRVITDDGSSLGQPLTTDAVIPAPQNGSLQQPPSTTDLQQQPASSQLQQPGPIE